MSRINKIVNQEIIIKTGIGGNVYAFSENQLALEELCEEIGKSKFSIYYSFKHLCYAFRVKAKHHKERMI